MKRYFCTVAAGLALALMSTATASADIGLPLPGQPGTQETNLGDQTVGEQRNDADVTQEQGNGNIAVSPAIAVFGDAETTNKQGNGNYAESDIDQENEVEQSQDSTQKQDSTQSGGSCCDGQSQTGEQKTSFGDQTVEKQENDADVEQKQGNGNIAVSPAIAIFGDAETTNKQGNGNFAESDIDQENEVEQSQDSYQRQSLDQSGSGGHCCHGSSQTGEQKTYGGDQTVEKQENDADVEQKQGNGNIAVSPAIAIFGDAESRNYQGNGNVAKSDIDQENEVEQSQSSTQKQELTQDGGDCCKPTYDRCKTSHGCQPKHEYGKEACCEHGSSQTGEQKTSFGDQTVGEQRNDADVTQKQGNDNFALSPAVGIGGGLREPCNSTCGKSRLPLGGDAKTTNYQGNGNVAKSDIDQENEVEQSQSSTQKQELTQDGGDCCKPTYDRCHSDGCRPEKEYDRKPTPSCSQKCEPRKEYGSKEYEKNPCCERGHDQTGSQTTYFGDQHVGEQRNDADVTQKQGNDNAAVSPALAIFGHAKTTNKQGNGNVAKSDIDQENEVEQRQTSYQHQDLVEVCKGLIYR